MKIKTMVNFDTANNGNNLISNRDMDNGHDVRETKTTCRETNIIIKENVDGLLDKSHDIKNGSNGSNIFDSNNSKDGAERNEKSSDEADIKDVEILDFAEPQPDGGYGWMVVFSSFMVHIFIGGIERSTGLFYLQFLNHYQYSSTVTAWICSLASCLRFILGPLTSAMSHYFSFRVTVMIGGILTCVSMVISAFAPNIYFQFFSFGFLSGVGRSFSYCPALVVVGYYFHKNRGKAVGIASSGAGLGAFLFPPVMDFLFEHYGFVGAFIMIGGLLLNVTVCGSLMRPLSVNRKIQGIQFRSNQRFKDEEVTLFPKAITRQDDNLNDTSKSTINVLEESEKNRTDCNFKQRKLSSVSNSKIKRCNSKSKTKNKLFEFSLLRDFRFLCFCIAIFLYTITYHSTFMFLPAYVKQIGESDSKAAFSVVIAGVCDGIGRILGGFILDLKKLKKHRIFLFNGIMFMIGSVPFIIPNLNSFIPIAFVCVVYGLLDGPYSSQKSVIIVDLLGPEKLNFSFGIMILFQGIGILIGPTIGGMLKDVNGKYDSAFYFGGSTMLLGACILLLSNVIYNINRKNREVK